MILSLLSALAAPPADPVVDALAEELRRAAAQLALPDAPPLYHLRYHVAQLEQRELQAAFGAVVHREPSPYNGLGVELRVGTPQLDNTGLGGWEDGFLQRPLAQRATPADARRIAWLATDAAYKQAVEQFARKQAQYTPPPDHPGDYDPPPAIITDDGEAPALDADRIEQLAAELSARFLAAAPLLERGEVHVGVEHGEVWLIDSEGTRLRRPLSEVTLRAIAVRRADDGELLTEDRLWCVRDDADLPESAAMLAEVDALRDAVVARADAPRLEDEYVGPVLFEADAAVDLFRYLLVPQLEGTPADIPFDTWFGDLGAVREQVRIGRRVLPEGWRAVDDPRSDPAAPSSYQHDWEGTPAERVELIEGGIVRDLLMSRVPRKQLRPNGHGRSFLGTRATGRAAQLTVSPPREASPRRLRRRALRLAADYGLDHILVVRRLQSFGVRNLASDGGGFDEGPALPPPVEVIRVHRDGTETPLRGARFAGVDRFALRDIALAGASHTTTYLAPLDGDARWAGTTDGMPTTLRAPAVLIRELELVASSPDPRGRPVLSPPEPGLAPADGRR